MEFALEVLALVATPIYQCNCAMESYDLWKWFVKFNLDDKLPISYSWQMSNNLLDWNFLPHVEWNQDTFY